MDDLKEKLSKWLELDYILPEDIPNIDPVSYTHLTLPTICSV